MKGFSRFFWVPVFLLIAAIYGFHAGPAQAAESPPTSSLSGKVVETMNSGGYTYVRLENSGKKIWVAVPEMKVQVGQELFFEPGITMTNFKSQTLKRTFDKIIFSNGVAGRQAAASPAKADGSRQAGAPARKAVKVKKASGPNGYTVAELYEKRNDLDKKEVVVRGQVVKVLAGIMGKNWVHLQDGSGDSSKATHDLAVTSQDLPSVGETVTARGTLLKDKDFGYGYNYPVIVEQARITK